MVTDMPIQDRFKYLTDDTEKADWSVLRWRGALTTILKDWADRSYLPGGRKALLLNTTVK